MRVLLLEDQPDIIPLLQELLHRHEPPIDWLVAGSLEHALRLVTDVGADLIFFDLALRHGPGLDTFDALHGAALDTPIIVLTGLEDDALAAQAMRRGAQDFLVRSTLSPATLCRSIRYSMERTTATRAVREQQEALRRIQIQLERGRRLEAIGQLAGGVAHEFNNLLGAVLVNSSALHDHLTDAEWKACAREIQEAAERMANLTRQLLSFSSRQMLQHRPVDLSELARGLEPRLRASLKTDVSFLLSLKPSLWSVMADPFHLERLVIDLTANARDALPAGGQITIETANVVLDRDCAERFDGLPPGPYVCLAISDTGSGMDPETISHLFEPFFTTKDVGRGSGLSLSAIYGIVRQLGGHVWVYSHPGRGSCFKICLPAVTDSPLPTLPLPRGAEVLLVVDDEPSIRRGVTNALTTQGYQVVSAADGLEALALLRRQPVEIDLLLTDLVMPGMGGRDLARRLVEASPRTKVIFTSGHTEAALQHQRMLEADTPFLSKPFSLGAVIRKVREVLDAPFQPLICP